MRGNKRQRKNAVIAHNPLDKLQQQQTILQQEQQEKDKRNGGRRSSGNNNKSTEPKYKVVEQQEIVQDDGTLSKEFFGALARPFHFPAADSSSGSNASIGANSKLRSSPSGPTNKMLAKVARQNKQGRSGSISSTMIPQQDAQLRLFFGLRQLNLNAVRYVIQANQKYERQQKQQKQEQEQQELQEEQCESREELQDKECEEEQQPIKLIKIKLCVHCQEPSTIPNTNKSTTKAQITGLSGIFSEGIHDDQWTELGSSEPVEIDVCSGEDTQSCTVNFKASILVKFAFEKVCVMRYTIVLADESNITICTSHSYLAQIVGSRNLVTKFELMNERTKISDLQVVAERNATNQTDLDLQKNVSERFLGDYETYLDATLSLDLLQKIPNSNGLYVMVSQMFKSKKEQRSNSELLSMVPKDRSVSRGRKKSMKFFKVDDTPEEIVPSLLNIDKSYSFVPLFTSEVVHTTSVKDIQFRSFTVKPQTDDRRIILRIDVFSYDKLEKESGNMFYKTLIGSKIISLDDMLSEVLNSSPNPASFKLGVVKHVPTTDSLSSRNVGNRKQSLFVLDAPKIHEPRLLDAGFIKVNSVKVRKESIKIEQIQSLVNSAIDYMKLGVRFRVLFGIDMTSDNKYPRNDPMLHYDMKIHGPSGEHKSIYEQAMQAVAERIDQYYVNKTDFHIIGFGHTDVISSQNLINIMMRDSVDPGIVSPGITPFKQSTNQAWMEAVLSRYEHPLMKSQLSAVYRHACRILQQKTNFSVSMKDVKRSLRYRSAELLEMTGSLEIPESISEDGSVIRSDLQEKRFGPNDFHHIISDVTEVCTQVKQAQPRHSVSLTESPLTGLQTGTASQGRKRTILAPLLRRKSKKMDAPPTPPSENKYLRKSTAGLQFEKNRSDGVLYPVYNILVIMVSNDHIDIQETIYSIVEASHKAPLSVIILGMGSGSAFKALRSIRMESKPSDEPEVAPDQRQWDYVPQTNYLQFKGLRAARDMCVFTRVNDFPSIEAAVEHSVSRISQHLCRFFRLHQQQKIN